MGLVGYYCHFIPNFADISFHLTEATKKAAPDLVLWSQDMLYEFDVFKNSPCSVSFFTLPLHSDKFVLQTDVSLQTLGLF